MTTISAISGSSQASAAWRPPPPNKAQGFARADGDGSGAVDSAELKKLFEQIKSDTGQSVGEADDLFATMDSNGDGGLDADELDTGMRDLMPQASSTMEFAQRSGGMPPGPPPPPPSDEAALSSAVSGLLGALMTTGDTNEDGTLSAEERKALEGQTGSSFTDLLDGLQQAGADAKASGSTLDLESLAQSLLQRYSAMAGEGNSTSSTLAMA